MQGLRVKKIIVSNMDSNTKDNQTQLSYAWLLLTALEDGNIKEDPNTVFTACIPCVGMYAYTIHSLLLSCHNLNNLVFHALKQNLTVE